MSELNNEQSWWGKHKGIILTTILIPILFVTSEILRENFAYGFPWITFALVHSGNTFTLNLIYYIGTYGLSYFTILMFLIPASIIQIYKKYTTNFILKTYISTSLAVALLSIILIFIRFEKNINKEKFLINTSIIQFNLSQIDRNNVSAEKRL